MTEKRLNEIKEKLLEAANLTFTLKIALANNDQPVNDTLPYSTAAEIIEGKIFSIFQMLEEN